METIKKFHANEYKPGKFICKVQIKGNRKSFYGNTEDEAISKAKLWYEDEIQSLETSVLLTRSPVARLVWPLSPVLV